MKWIMQFLARLYPSSWRERYGAEFGALLEDATPSARNAFDILWGAFKMQMTVWNLARTTLACCVVGIFVALGISFAVPVHYRSQAVFTVTSPSEREARRVLNTLEDHVFSRESLIAIIQEHNLYPQERAAMLVDDAIYKMKRDIGAHPVPLASAAKRDTHTFVIQFDYANPVVAQQVNEDLAVRFIRDNFEVASKLGLHSVLERGESTLPIRPAAPNRKLFATFGLFAGLLAGLAVAIVLKSHRSMSVGND